MSSIIKVAYQQRLFTMLSSNLIKIFRVNRNILTLYEKKSIKSPFSSVLVFSSQNFEIYIDISIFKAVAGFSYRQTTVLVSFLPSIRPGYIAQRLLWCICALFTTSSLRNVSANLHTIYANLMWSKSRDFKKKGPTIMVCGTLTFSNCSVLFR